MAKKRMVGNGLLLLAAMIWGAAFVAQSVGMDHVGPFTFQAVRCLLGSFILLPAIPLMDRVGLGQKPASSTERKQLYLGGLLCGLCLFVACAFQQLGLLYTTPGKSGFFTSLYIIFVPIFGLFLKKRVTGWVGVSVVLAAVGLYFLCGGGDFSMGPGELLTLGCAIAFTFHILIVDRFCHVDGVRLSCLQFLVCGLLSAVCMFLFETPRMDGILQCWLPLIYAGCLSAGVGFTLQIIGQKFTEPTVASLLMSLESVFSVVFGWIILGQALTPTELAGCGLVFGGVILAQMPGKRKVLA